MTTAVSVLFRIDRRGRIEVVDGARTRMSPLTPTDSYTPHLGSSHTRARTWTARAYGANYGAGCRDASGGASPTARSSGQAVRGGLQPPPPMPIRGRSGGR